MPIHSDLLREPARRNYLLPAPNADAGLEGAFLSEHLSQLAYTLCPVAVTRCQAQRRVAAVGLWDCLGGPLGRSLPDDLSGVRTSSADWLSRCGVGDWVCFAVPAIVR